MIESEKVYVITRYNRVKLVYDRVKWEKEKELFIEPTAFKHIQVFEATINDNVKELVYSRKNEMWVYRK